jgi:hypothetical protein
MGIWYPIRKQWISPAGAARFPTDPMKFSWNALALAPLPVPLAVAALLAATMGGGNRLAGFVFFLVAGLLISYGATLVLLLPATCLLPARATDTAARAALLGAVLGALALLPLAWIGWRASGPNSGPPPDGFAEHLLRDITDPVTLAFPLAGMVTAVLYRRLAGHPSREDETAP